MKIGKHIDNIMRYSDNYVNPSKLALTTILNEFRYVDVGLVHVISNKLYIRLINEIDVLRVSLRNTLEN